jgi:hypothetical protein
MYSRLPLLPPRDVEEELENDEAVVREVLLEVIDVPVTSRPDAFLEVRRKLLRVELLGVNLLRQNLLVVRAVEDADLPAVR